MYALITQESNLIMHKENYVEAFSGSSYFPIKIKTKKYMLLVKSIISYIFVIVAGMSVLQCGLLLVGSFVHTIISIEETREIGLESSCYVRRGTHE